MKLPLLRPWWKRKKRGRPPLNKAIAKNISKLTGAKSSKRNMMIVQNSPTKRTTSGKSITPSGENGYGNREIPREHPYQSPTEASSSRNQNRQRAGTSRAYSQAGP